LKRLDVNYLLTFIARSGSAPIVCSKYAERQAIASPKAFRGESGWERLALGVVANINFKRFPRGLVVIRRAGVQDVHPSIYRIHVERQHGEIGRWGGVISMVVCGPLVPCPQTGSR
jgi:hypothetical protein